MTALYDTIGTSFDQTRRADLRIVNHLHQLFAPQPGEHFLDIGCGSGNYTIALSQKGMDMVGMDLSAKMLAKACLKESSVKWVHGNALSMSFPAHSFDGILCFLAIHHIRDLSTFFAEVARILKPKGKFLLFTNSPSQLMQLWFVHYFPLMMRYASLKLYSKKQIQDELEHAGLGPVSFQKYFVEPNPSDAFLEAALFHPEFLLDPSFRANVSPFALAPNKDEIEEGLLQLKQDIASGRIKEIQASFDCALGNFYYILSPAIR